MQSWLGEALGEHARNFVNVENGKRRFSTVLSAKACLIVQDDIWEVTHAQAVDALGANCRMLITTRNLDQLRTLGVNDYTVDLLDEVEAKKLLAQWATLNPAELPAEANEIVKECGRLPLAIVGALVRDRS